MLLSRAQEQELFDIHERMGNPTGKNPTAQRREKNHVEGNPTPPIGEKTLEGDKITLNAVKPGEIDDSPP